MPSLTVTKRIQQCECLLTVVDLETFLTLIINMEKITKNINI